MAWNALGIYMSDKLQVANYIGAFIDIQGQSERLSKLPFLNTTDKEIILPWLKDTYGLINKFREGFKEFLRIINPENSQIIGSIEVTTPEIKMNPVSDSLFLYISLYNDEISRHMAIISLMGLISACTLNYLLFLSIGRPFRGGIDIGVGIEDEFVKIYGSVISNAYNLECKVADYPRIVIGERIVNYLEKNILPYDGKRFDGDMKLYSLSCEMSKAILSQIITDDRGVKFINPLHPQYLEICNRAEMKNVVIECYDFILSSVNQYKDNNNKLHRRYLSLKAFFDANIGEWLK
jgi:hypothetical protein